MIVVTFLGAMMTGCASDSKAAHCPVANINEPISPDRVPASAKLQASGTGELGFRAKVHGRGWLFDDDRKTVIFSTLMEKGERLTVAPGHHRASLNGEDVGVNDIFERNSHAIYFLALAK